MARTQDYLLAPDIVNDPLDLFPDIAGGDTGASDIISRGMEDNPFAEGALITAGQAFAPAGEMAERAASLARYQLPGTRTGMGTTQMVGGQLRTSLDPRFAGASQQLTNMASGALSGQGPFQQQQALAQQQSMLGMLGYSPTTRLQREAMQAAGGAFGALGSFDPMSATQEQFARMESLLAPGRERERLAQEGRLYAQGRLGSTGGALEQQALTEAQEQTRTANMMQAYQTALQQQQQLAGLGQQLGGFGAGLEQSRQQQALQQLAAAGGLEEARYQRGLGALGAAGQLEQLPLQQLAAAAQIAGQQAAAGAEAGAFLMEPQIQRGIYGSKGALGLTTDFTNFMGGMFGGRGMGG